MGATRNLLLSRKTNFKPRPFRTQGTYGKYASIDDKIDDLHYYTTYKVWNWKSHL